MTKAHAKFQKYQYKTAGGVARSQISKEQTDNMIKTNVKNRLQKGSTIEAYPLEWSVKILLEVLNMFNGTCTNLTISSDVDQNT